MFGSLKLDFLTSIQEKIDARVMRERALILLTICAFIFMLWNFLLQSSIDKKTRETQESINALRTQSTALQTQIAASTQSMLNDPDKQKKVKIEQLQTDIKDIESQLQRVSQNLIKADQLPRALQEVLEKTAQLKLLEVKTLPAQELHFVEAKANVEATTQASVAEEQRAGVYQHAVELRLAGSYGQILNFLIGLEKLPWRFYWQELEYTVEHYPDAEVRLRVYTLSAEEGLLGV